MSSESLADRLEAWLVPAPTNDTEKQQERTALHVIAVVEAAAALRAQQKREQDLHDCLHLVGMERDTALSRIAELQAEKYTLTRQVVELTELLNQNGIDPA